MLDQLLYFADIVSVLEPSNLNGRTDFKILSCFIYRMSSFLSVKGKQTLVEKFPPSDYPMMWYIFGVKNFPEEALLSQALVTSSVANIEMFLSSSCDVSAFIKMVNAPCCDHTGCRSFEFCYLLVLL